MKGLPGSILPYHQDRADVSPQSRIGRISMNIKKQPPVALIVLALVTLLVVSGLFSLRLTTAEAGGLNLNNVGGQNTPPNDLKSKVGVTTRPSVIETTQGSTCPPVV